MVQVEEFQTSITAKNRSPGECDLAFFVSRISFLTWSNPDEIEWTDARVVCTETDVRVKIALDNQKTSVLTASSSFYVRQVSYESHEVMVRPHEHTRKIM
jgi:hypothetical protein